MPTRSPGTSHFKLKSVQAPSLGSSFQVSQKIPKGLSSFLDFKNYPQYRPSTNPLLFPVKACRHLIVLVQKCDHIINSQDYFAQSQPGLLHPEEWSKWAYYEETFHDKVKQHYKPWMQTMIAFKGYIMPDLQVYIIEDIMLTIPGC